jgi:hypothetical protein
MQVTVALHPEGPIAIKAARGATDAARLRLEAERLERAAHPGLVAVVAAVPGPGTGEPHGGDCGDDTHNATADAGDPIGDRGSAEPDAVLRTRFAGDPVSHWTGSVERVAGLGAAVAATLADLHGIGVVHGRLDATHILVGDDGRPRLCGLSHPGGAEPHDDVAALARVLGDVLARAGTQPRLTRPWFGRSGTAHRRALEQVIARALDPVPSRRPTARLLASSLLAAVPGAELPAGGPRSPAPEPRPVPPDEHLLELVFSHELTDDERWAQAFGDQPPEPGTGVGAEPAPASGERGGRARVAAGSGAAALAAIAAGAVFVGGWGWRGSGGQPAAVQATAPGSRGDCPAAAAPAADVNGDGCAEALVVEGGTVSAGPISWTLGQPGDLIAVGDWACDGGSAPALLRPSTGDVFVFPGWAAEGEPVTVEARDRLPGAVAIRGEPGDDGCDDLVVDLGSGATARVEVRR